MSVGSTFHAFLSFSLFLVPLFSHPPSHLSLPLDHIDVCSIREIKGRETQAHTHVDPRRLPSTRLVRSCVFAACVCVCASVRVTGKARTSAPRSRDCLLSFSLLLCLTHALPLPSSSRRMQAIFPRNPLHQSIANQGNEERRRRREADAGRSERWIRASELRVGCAAVILSVCVSNAHTHSRRKCETELLQNQQQHS